MTTRRQQRFAESNNEPVAMLPSQHGGGGGFLGRLVSAMFAVFVVLLALQALLIVITPLLPWIGLAAVVVAGFSLWNQLRNRW